MMTPESTFIVSSVVSYGAFIGVSAFFAKRWMDRVDASTSQIYRERKEDAVRLAEELKISAKEHRLEVAETARNIEKHLDQIYQQLRIANGRTAKLEGNLQEVRAVCAERHPNGNGK